jgi:hypothetical protein
MALTRAKLRVIRPVVEIKCLIINGIIPLTYQAWRKVRYSFRCSVPEGADPGSFTQVLLLLLCMLYDLS